MKLYHGTCTAGIGTLEARSVLHGTQKRVVYLTDCPAYALLYIWDGEKHRYSRKYVTAWVKDGVAHYEEQFSGQLRAFYQGVSGWLYTVEAASAEAVGSREGLFSVEGSAPVAKAEFIPDVYEELLRREQAGQLVVLRHDEQPQLRREALTDMIAEDILRHDFYRDDPEHQAFLNRYFAKAMAHAAGKR